MSVAEGLERSRGDVLDLTLRNPLLNFRVLKAKGLEIIDEIPQEVYKIVVGDGRVMYFEAAALIREMESRPEANSPGEDQESPEELLSLIEAGDEDAPDELAARHVDNKLQTPYQQARLGIRLRNTYRHAHSSIEEQQGVNILYLALGMLCWYESESSDIERMAPLILVPVELSRSSARARFKVKWTGEEIDANLSLETKFKADFGIELPKLAYLNHLHFQIGDLCGLNPLQTHQTDTCCRIARLCKLPPPGRSSPLSLVNSLLLGFLDPVIYSQ